MSILRPGHFSPEDAARCRLKNGHDIDTADFAFLGDEDRLQAAQSSRQTGKSGHLARSLSGRSQWPETNKGLNVNILFAIFKEPLKAALCTTSMKMTVTPSDQPMKV